MEIKGTEPDNLSSFVQGVFVLQDTDFPWISPFASDISMRDTAKMAVLVWGGMNDNCFLIDLYYFQYLAFPCGLLRGALSGLGVQATVTAEIPAFNQCNFEIRINQQQWNIKVESNKDGNEMKCLFLIKIYAHSLASLAS